MDAPVRGTAKIDPIKRNADCSEGASKKWMNSRPTFSALPPRAATTITAIIDNSGSLMRKARVAIPQFSPAVTPR